MAILIVAFVGVMVFPHAGVAQTAAAPNTTPSATPGTPAISAAPSLAGPQPPILEAPAPTPVTTDFATAGSMAIARDGHTATLLPNGTVLVVGGHGADETRSYAAAELFDPATGTFSPTGSMAQERWQHTATPLGDGTGRVLVVGGFDDQTQKTTTSAELYDPATGKFSPTGSLSQARYGQTATLLADGRVLVAGGQSRALALSSAEIYDPKTATFTSTGSMAQSRFGQAATLLPSGKVLVTGGYNAAQTWLASAELFDPATGKFSPTGSMESTRVYHSSILLATGRVLISGGGSRQGFGQSLSSAEIYDPATGKFSPTGSMTDPRAWQSASTLADGRVLIAGGQKGMHGAYISSAEIFDPLTEKFTAVGSMHVARSNQTATTLSDGRSFIAGGDDGSGKLSSAELFG
jgi:hypothetical protein